jgi:hypothetical protein
MRTIELKNGNAEYHSTNYQATQDNFKILEYNRGKDTGFDKDRVKGLMDLIMSDKFVWLLSTIKVLYRKSTKSLIVLDGANRVSAVRELIKIGKLDKDFKIPFTIINTPLLNTMNNKDLIDFISVVNEYDPRWKENEHFNAANASKLLTASMFKFYVDEYKKHSLRLRYKKDNKNKSIPLKLNVLNALATQTPIDSGVTTMRYKDFRDETIGQHMLKDEFRNDFNALIDYLEIVKVWNQVRDIRISRCLLHVLSVVYNKNIRVSFTYLVSKLKETNKMPEFESDIKTFLYNLL